MHLKSTDQQGRLYMIEIKRYIKDMQLDMHYM